MLENLKIAVGCEANYHQMNLQSFVILLPTTTKKEEKKEEEDTKLKK